MYKFVDVTSGEGGEPLLPTEALKFNGQFLEHKIPGYRTLSVSGREMMDVDIYDLEVGTANGSKFRGKRYPSRTITVRYQLICENAEKFRESYNKLNEILNADQAQLIFNDEPEWYFIGTKSGGTVPDPGKNSVTGEIDFYCPDPFKYSVDEKEVSPTLDGGKTFAIDYQGGYRAYPTIEATMLSDNGFVGYVDDKQHILQFGSVDEVDGEDYQKSETLVDDGFTTTPSGWRLNQATTVNNGSEHKQDGTLGFDSAGAYASNYGAGTNWHGPGYAKTVPQDSSGHSGSKNCTLSWHHRFAVTSTNSMGVVQFHMTDASKRNVASVTYFKNTKGSNEAMYHLYVNGKMRKYVSYTCQESNPITGSPGGRSSITKFGGKFEFNIAGQVTSLEFPEMADIEVTEVSIFIGKWGNDNPIEQNSVYSVKFVSHSVDDWRDVPNKFSLGDVLKIDCTSGKVSLNGVESYGLGALGNDWEDFYLSPGINQIMCAWSDFATKPSFKLKYREVRI